MIGSGNSWNLGIEEVMKSEITEFKTATWWASMSGVKKICHWAPHQLSFQNRKLWQSFCLRRFFGVEYWRIPSHRASLIWRMSSRLSSVRTKTIEKDIRYPFQPTTSTCQHQHTYGTHHATSHVIIAALMHHHVFSFRPWYQHALSISHDIPCMWCHHCSKVGLTAAPF